MIEVTVSPGRIQAGAAAEVQLRLTNQGPGICRRVIFTIALPAGIIRLSGKERTEEGRLLPGKSITVPLRIQADHPGVYELTSPNFSYVDHHGQARRISGYTVGLTVDPEPAPLPVPHRPEPRVTVELQTAELPQGEWSSLRCRIVNGGATEIHALEIVLSGQVDTDQGYAPASLGRLPAGRSADLAFFVCARQPGTHVPVHLALSYSDEDHRYQATTTHTVSVNHRRLSSVHVPPEKSARIRLLFMGSEPMDTARLGLGWELAQMQQIIKAGRERDKFEISIRLAVRPDDIGPALLDIEPHIVHFAGHGGGADGSFAAEDEHRHAQFLPVDALVQMFRAAGGCVDCVVVNACNTEQLAQALAERGRSAIGMRRPVGDQFAVGFSTAFYQALAAGRSVEEAFDYSLAQLRLLRAPGADRSAPLLFTSSAGKQHPETKEAITAARDATPGPRVSVTMESECSQDDLLAVAGVFEAFRIPADVRGSYARRSAVDLPWVVVIGVSAWSAGTFLKAALQAAGDEAGRETWRTLMRLVRAIYRARQASHSSTGEVFLRSSEPPLDVQLPPDLPDGAYYQLGEIEKPHPLSGILMWDSDAQTWIDAGDNRPEN